MKDTNIVVLVGRVARDSEMKQTSSGISYRQVDIAYTRNIKKGDKYEDQISYISFTLWGSRAEGIGKFLTKGKQICVSGELELQQWESKGEKRSKTVISDPEVQLFSDGRGNTEKNTASVTHEQKTSDDFVFEDDIPF